MGEFEACAIEGLSASARSMALILAIVVAFGAGLLTAVGLMACAAVSLSRDSLRSVATRTGPLSRHAFLGQRHETSRASCTPSV